jgi:hypothetical protein
MRSALTTALLTAFTLTAIGWAQQPTNVPQAKPSEAAAPPRSSAQLVNVRVDLTITDTRDGAAGAPKVVSLVIADRDSGRIRTGSGDTALNVDARPEIVREGRIRVHVSLEYHPGREDPGKTAPPGLVESLTAILEDGRPLTVSQSADPASSRSVKVEMKASILNRDGSKIER